MHRVCRDGEDGDGRGRRIRANLPRRFPARKQGKGKIHQDEVRPEAASRFDRGAAVRHGGDLVAFRLEEKLHERPDVGRVLGDQDAGHVPRSLLALCRRGPLAQAGQDVAASGAVSGAGTVPTAVAAGATTALPQTGVDEHYMTLLATGGLLLAGGAGLLVHRRRFGGYEPAHRATS